MATLQAPALAAYSAMNLGKHALWGLLSGLGLYYLTEELGVSPSWAGAILMASLLMDAAIDLPIGGLLDQWRARLPSYLVPVVGSVMVCAASMAVFFSAGHVLPHGIVVPVALVGLFLFRVAFTVFDLSDNALASRITTDAQDRTTASVWRKLAAGLAGLGLALATSWTLEPDTDMSGRFLLLGIGAAVAVTVVVVVGYLRLMPLDRAAAPFAEVSIPVRWRALRRSRDVWTLGIVTLLEASTTPIFTAGLLFFAAAVHGMAALAGTALAVITAGQILSLPVWWWLSNRLGKCTALQAAHLVGALGATAFMLVADQGQEAQAMAVLVLGISGGGVSTLRWSIAPDLVDRTERVTGVRVESGIIALLTGAIQVGAGLAAGLLGLGLAVLEHPQSEIPALTLAGLIAGPAVLAHAACALILGKRGLLEPPGVSMVEAGGTPADG